MWLSASKILGAILAPLPLSLLVFLFGVLLGGIGFKLFGRFCRVFAISLLLVCSMPAFESYLRSTLDQQYPATPIEETPQAALIVVLGGAIAKPTPPRLQVEIVDSSDRVLHAFRLLTAGKAPLIFLSGGNLVTEPGVKSEAYYIAELLEEWGVSRSLIISEGYSRTTYENARTTLKYLTNLGLQDEQILLVTSAIHMPRAAAVFEKAGLNVIPSPADVSAARSFLPGIFSYLPSVNALGGVSKIWHEYLGSWVYKASGWL